MSPFIVIYQLDQPVQKMIVLKAGHRREVYEQAIRTVDCSLF